MLSDIPLINLAAYLTTQEEKMYVYVEYLYMCVYFWFHLQQYAHVNLLSIIDYIKFGILALNSTFYMYHFI